MTKGQPTHCTYMDVASRTCLTTSYPPPLPPPPLSLSLPPLPPPLPLLLFPPLSFPPPPPPLTPSFSEMKDLGSLLFSLAEKRFDDSGRAAVLEHLLSLTATLLVCGE